MSWPAQANRRPDPSTQNIWLYTDALPVRYLGLLEKSTMPRVTLMAEDAPESMGKEAVEDEASETMTEPRNADSKDDNKDELRKEKKNMKMQRKTILAQKLVIPDGEGNWKTKKGRGSNARKTVAGQILENVHC